MSVGFTPKRPHRYLLVAILATPSLLAILASLWPLEPVTLFLECAVLGIVVFAALVFVRSIRQLMIGITTLAVLLSVATSNWPLRVAYTFSRPSFDRMASQVRLGEKPQTPCSIGPFRIQKAEVRPNGIVCLWTDDDPSGRTGFVQSGSDNLRFNLWSHIELDDSWQFISED